jgi:hypothetical protein
MLRERIKSRENTITPAILARPPLSNLPPSPEEKGERRYLFF